MLEKGFVLTYHSKILAGDLTAMIWDEFGLYFLKNVYFIYF